jgi:hypothetical protein
MKSFIMSLVPFIAEYDLEMFLHFVKRFMHKMFVQVEMFGSVTKEDVKDISKSILDMKYYPFKRRVEIDDRATRIPLGTNILRFRSRHAAYRTTVVCNYYQFGVLSGVDVQIFWMFCKILKKNAYHQLRFLLINIVIYLLVSLTFRFFPYK